MSTIAEIAKSGLVHYALATGFDANCLSPKQSRFYDFYQHAALSMLMAIRCGEAQPNTRYTVLDAYFTRSLGKYGSWADDVIKTVRSKNNDGQRIKSFDTYFVTSMRDPYAAFCKPDPVTMKRIAQRLDGLKDDYLAKREVITKMVMAGEITDPRPQLAIFM